MSDDFVCRVMCTAVRSIGRQASRQQHAVHCSLHRAPYHQCRDTGAIVRLSASTRSSSSWLLTREIHHAHSTQFEFFFRDSAQFEMSEQWAGPIDLVVDGHSFLGSVIHCLVQSHRTPEFLEPLFSRTRTFSFFKCTQVEFERVDQEQDKLPHSRQTRSCILITAECRP